MIGIIGAMETEVKDLCEKLTDRQEVEFGGLKYNKGRLLGKDVVIVKSGIGKVNSALCAQALILKFGADSVINTGIAGATGGNLGIFDFVVSEKTLYHDVDVAAFGYPVGQLPGMSLTFDADSKMIAAAEQAFVESDFSKEHKILKGLIASGDQFIDDGVKKDFIKSNFNPLCVEMEGCSIAHACTLNKVPFIIVRCMSDMADDTVEQTYSFNEDVCAEMSGKLVLKIIEKL